MSDPSRFDVIVVGGGGSGLATAASAAENGARVLVLEKQSELGGATGIAVGSFTTNKTRFQEKAGISDSLDAHVEDAGKFAPPEIEAKNAAEIRRFFITHSSDTLDWLVGMGLAFHGPNPEPPNRVNRMHNVAPGARAYISALAAVVRRGDGTILTDAAVRIIVQEGGRIVGVEADVTGERKTFYASRGVVLAAGDYANAPDLIGRFKGEAFSEIEGIYENARGDGHRLAEEAGAELVNMEITYGPELRFVPPEAESRVDRLMNRVPRPIFRALTPFVPKRIVDSMIKRRLVTWQHPEDSLFEEGAILVNGEGNRFCDESDSPGREIALSAQPGKVGYILLDRRLIDRFGGWPHFISTAPEIAYAYVKDYLRLRPDVAAEGSSIREVAEKRGIPSENLEATVASFNEGASEGEQKGSRLEGDRWVLLGPAKAYFTTTEGSPAIDLRMRVLDREGNPIEGLYAVGQNGLGGQVLWGHGLHIAWAITSGRLVGKALARGEAEG